MEHILSLSYGKDSLACLGAIDQLGWPLDRIVHAEVWATDTIPADLPPMVDFKEKADTIIKNKYGIKVEHICARRNMDKLTYEKVFYQKRKFCKDKNNLHDIYGWPFQKGPWCNDRLKTSVLDSIGLRAVQYIGIAADEKNRFHVLSDNKKSPLVEANWTEEMCYKWCEENDLLSPIYNTSMRGGCWFCHNQGISQLRKLRKNYPDLWKLMLKWDSDSPVIFQANGHTVHDFEERFLAEDEHLVPSDRTFRWKYLEEIKQKGALKQNQSSH